MMAQSDDEEAWREQVELWAEQNDEEAVPDDLAEQVVDLVDNPVNLNDTVNDVLVELSLLNDFQQRVLRAYIAQNGPLASLSELYLMNGFDSVTIARIRPYVSVIPVEPKGLKMTELMKKGHSNLRWGTKTVWPRSRGYAEDIYQGDAFRMYFRYLYRCGDKISVQLSGDKDAGEAFRFKSADDGVNAQRGFDYYGYHLMLNDFGVVKRAIIGKYQMQFGQGLTLWSGFAPWLSENTSLRRYGQGIRPASAFCEYGYLRGAAVTLALPAHVKRSGMELTLFYSNVDRDATLRSDSVAVAEVQYQSFYQSGYHRTENELSKKAQLNEQLFGGRIEYRSNSLQLGGTAYGTWLASPIVPVEYVYNAFAFSGMRNLNAGIDVTYRYCRLLLFGECSVSDNDAVRGLYERSGWFPMAAVAGLQFYADSRNALSAVAYIGSPTYQNLHAVGVGHASGVQNKEGVMVHCKVRLPFALDVRAMVDLFRHPWMRYRVYSPSVGSDCRLWVSKAVANNTVLELQYRHHTEQRNSDAHLYYVEDTRRQHLRLSLIYQASSWRLLSRVMMSWFDCDDHAPQQGFLLSQEASYKTKVFDRNISLGGHVSVFDVTDYDARIYNYESDLLYELSAPMLMGRGVRCGMILRHDLSRTLSLAAKYTMAIYPENESLGSGYDRIEGPIRHEVKLQLRLKF